MPEDVPVTIPFRGLSVLLPWVWAEPFSEQDESGGAGG